VGAGRGESETMSLTHAGRGAAVRDPDERGGKVTWEANCAITGVGCDGIAGAGWMEMRMRRMTPLRSMSASAVHVAG